MVKTIALKNDMVDSGSLLELTTVAMVMETNHGRDEWPGDGCGGVKTT